MNIRCQESCDIVIKHFGLKYVMVFGHVVLAHGIVTKYVHKLIKNINFNFF